MPQLIISPVMLRLCRHRSQCPECARYKFCFGPCTINKKSHCKIMFSLFGVAGHKEIRPANVAGLWTLKSRSRMKKGKYAANDIQLKNKPKKFPTYPGSIPHTSRNHGKWNDYLSWIVGYGVGVCSGNMLERSWIGLLVKGEARHGSDCFAGCGFQVGEALVRSINPANKAWRYGQYVFIGLALGLK